MIVPLAHPPVTADEFERLPDREFYELADGELVEKPAMGTEAAWVAGELNRLLATHAKNTHAGWVFPPDTEFASFPDRPNTVRKPDGAFVRFGRLEGERLPRGRCRLAPDLAVEVISPNDKAEEVEAKNAEYLAASIRLLWVIYPASRVVYVFRADGGVTRLTDAEELTGGDVLPGFVCPVRNLFPPPPPTP